MHNYKIIRNNRCIDVSVPDDAMHEIRNGDIARNIAYFSPAIILLTGKSGCFLSNEQLDSFGGIINIGDNDMQVKSWGFPKRFDEQ